MTQTTEHPRTVEHFLAEPLRLGDPLQAANLTLFPLFGPEPGIDYISFAQGRSAGVRVGELEGGASVNDLMVENPSERTVILFEGEEVIGAQQNRTFDVSVLVAAGTKVVVPVSCMEHGRWDGRRHREEMRPAPQTANPRMRRAKAEESRRSVSAGFAARADQSRVWSDIDQERALHAADAPTGASHDIYESRRDRLNEICAELPLAGGQVGSIVAINGELSVLDYVSRPEVYGSLHGRLIQGYGLDALAAESDEDPSVEDSVARGFALLAADAPIAYRTRGAGLGEEIRFAANGVAGSGLVHEDELVQLSVFPGENGNGPNRPAPRGGRVRRPSRRRQS